VEGLVKTKPGKYYQNNVANVISLLNSLVERGISKFIFSSSCATYGEPDEIPIPEDHPQKPVNPYGRTKLMVEQILDDFCNAYGMKSITLRYFNAAGGDSEGELGEDHEPETHLIPLVLKTALGQRESIHIFGNDYPTKDGTCIRDYVHVQDLAQAHFLALERLLDGHPGGKLNLSNGEGYSVKEIIEVARRVTGMPISQEMEKRRPGDPAVLVGSSTRAINELGWNPQFPELHSIIDTAWAWHKNNPAG
jgi:UDP-glucose 4-epimerase